MITVKELTKRYGAHTAVDALSFTVDKGQIYGLLGPNGAGKSTTMNIITGYISATDGTAEIDGCDIFDSPAEARAKIGYLPEQPPLYTDMTPREYLAFAAELKGLPREQRKAAVEQCMERTNIADVADRLIRNLSKGYRQRVGLACALLELLGSRYPKALEERYKVAGINGLQGWELLEQCAQKRGMLISGGEVDTERMAKVLLDEFRGGKLGRFTLETPEDI